MLVTLTRPDSGAITLAGEPLLHERRGDSLVPAGEQHLRKTRKHTTMVFQQYDLFPNMRVPRDVARTFDVTTLCVTHAMEFARDVSDRVLLFDEGRIIESAPPDELFDAPRQARTRRSLCSVIDEPRPPGSQGYRQVRARSEWEDHPVAVGDGAIVLVIREDDSVSSVEVARWVEQRLDGWPPEDVMLVGVVAGELFDNAVAHGSAPYVLELDLDEFGEAMMVTVRDRARGRSWPWRPSAGLLLVDALSSRWGVLAREGTTAVYAKLDFEG
ncbi:hypothetical protein [Saccharothrix saharensis]|nr:hypothetical protein [Saccharothrix saharensis]